MANRGCTIESCGKKITLTLSAFEGGVPVEIQHTDLDKGTVIKFVLNKEELRSLEWTIEKVAKHFPITVHYQGKQVAQSDFLEGALFTKEWSGLRIGVFNEHPSGQHTLNFHGVTVRESLAWEVVVFIDISINTTLQKSM